MARPVDHPALALILLLALFLGACADLGCPPPSPALPPVAESAGYTALSMAVPFAGIIAYIAVEQARYECALKRG